MSKSLTILKCKLSKMEVSVDVSLDINDEPTYTLSIGTGFGIKGEASVNIETSAMSRAEYRTVLAMMADVLQKTE